jgi:hypothetical protein
MGGTSICEDELMRSDAVVLVQQYDVHALIVADQRVVSTFFGSLYAFVVTRAFSCSSARRVDAGVATTSRPAAKMTWIPQDIAALARTLHSHRVERCNIRDAVRWRSDGVLSEGATMISGE